MKNTKKIFLFFLIGFFLIFAFSCKTEKAKPKNRVVIVKKMVNKSTKKKNKIFNKAYFINPFNSNQFPKYIILHLPTSNWILSNVENNIIIFPDANFVLKKSSERTIKIIFTKTLKERTQYKISYKDSSFYFETPKFALNSVLQVDHKKPIFEFTFNSPVSIESFKNALSVKVQHNKIKFKVLTKENSKKIRVKLSLNRKAKINFKFRNLVDVSKQNTIAEIDRIEYFSPILYQIFIINGYFRTNETGFDFIMVMREDDETGRDRYKYNRRIWEYQVPDIDTEEFKENIIIKPKVKFAILKVRDGYKIKGDFKPQTQYSILVKKGLKAKNGKVLLKDFIYKGKLGNYKPSIKILSKGHIIPKIYDNKIVIKVCNLHKLNVSVREIYPQNIIFWLTGDRNRSRDNISDIIFKKDFTFNLPDNQFNLKYLDLNQFLPKDKKGVFQLELNDVKGRVDDSIQLVISNMAISAKKGKKLHVYIHDFTTLKPISNVKVKLYSYSNKVLAEKTTDVNGKVTFANTQAYAIIATKSDDWNYFVFDEPQIDLSEYDISGENYNNKYEYKAYVYPDRGVYRPNDTANISVILRNNKKLAPKEEFPIRIKVYNSVDKIILSKTMKINSVGMLTFPIRFYNTPSTGKYKVKVFLGKNEVGFGTFNVEEFVPERMKVEIKTEKPQYIQNENIVNKLRAIYLFGATAKNNRYEVEYAIKPLDFKIKSLKGYHFSKYNLNKVRPTYITTKKGKLNKKGEAKLSLSLVENNITIKTPMQLNIFASVFEGGSGKTSKGYGKSVILPKDYLIGIKTNEKTADYGKKVEIQGIVTDVNGNIRNDVKNVKVELLRVEYDWYYYFDEYEDEYNWQWVPYTYTVDEKIINVKNGEFSYNFTPKSYWGGYIIRTKSLDNKMISDIFLPAEWEWRYNYNGNKRSTSELRKYKDPEYLEITTDKDQYNLGDTAKISVNCKYEGILHFSVETDKLIYDKWLPVKIGKNEFNYKINTDVPNIYFLVSFFKKMPKDLSKGFQPVQAFGLKSIEIIPKKYILPLSVDVPDTIQPNDEFTITLKTNANEKKIYATIAAVDEGILQLTRFKSPDPIKFFFKKCRLEVDTYENYGWLMGKIGQMKKEGGGMNESIQAHGKRRVSPVKIVSLFKGLVNVQNGVAHIKMKVPYFNGQLRLMIVAVSENKMGSINKKITVRDPLVLMPSVPRFVTNGDRFVIPVNITNFTGKKGKFNIDVIAENAEVTPLNKGPFTLKKRDNITAKFEIYVKKYIGNVKLTIKANGNNFYSEESFKIPIIPPTFEQTFIKRIKLKKGSNDITQYFSNWVPEYENDTVLISSFPFLNGLLGIKKLVRYPFGCIEQTTSFTFPLLYIENILKPLDPAFLKDKDVKKMVMHGIERVLNMQLPSGGFGYWPDSNYVSKWYTIYATHMLLEAQKAGYNVPEESLKSALDFIENEIYYDYNNYYQGYGFYVLALAGRKNIEKIKEYLKWIQSQRNYYRESEEMFFLGSALILEGKREDGMKILTPYFDKEPENIVRKNDYSSYSSLRELALKLFLLEEIAPGSEYAVKYADKIAYLLTLKKHFSYYNTQELAWSVCALGKFIKYQKPKIVKKANLIMNGKKYPLQKLGMGKVMNGTGFSSHKSIVINVSKPTFAYITINGYPKYMNKAPESSGISVELFSKNINGKPKSLENGYQLGDLGIIEVKIRNNTGENLKNIALVVRIPAGFAIENPRLGAQHAINWMNNKVWAYNHMDIRDDRLQIFGNLNSHEVAYIYFAVRATFKGVFTIPGTSVEVMYSPEIHSYTELKQVYIGDEQK